MRPLGKGMPRLFSLFVLEGQLHEHLLAVPVGVEDIEPVDMDIVGGQEFDLLLFVVQNIGRPLQFVEVILEQSPFLESGGRLHDRRARVEDISSAPHLSSNRLAADIPGDRVSAWHRGSPLRCGY